MSTKTIATLFNFAKELHTIGYTFSSSFCEQVIKENSQERLAYIVFAYAIAVKLKKIDAPQVLVKAKEVLKDLRADKLVDAFDSVMAELDKYHV